MGEQTTYINKKESNKNKEELFYFEKSEFDKIIKTKSNWVTKKKVLSNMLRLNILYMIQNAGSGHIGTSFSSIDLVNYIYFDFLNKEDIYFSSKGHDAPALYSVLMAKNILPFSNIHKFRKIKGLPGHPDIKTKGIYTNTGSLGMGVSKAKGFLLANNLKKKSRKVVVLTGDGELQEGQFWESLINIPKNISKNLTIIIDYNKYQSDLSVQDTSSLGNLKNKLESFNVRTFTCDGNNFIDIKKTFKKIENIHAPKAIIAYTVKGKGVSFMEGRPSIKNIYYNYHSGSLKYEEYLKAVNELFKNFKKIDRKLPVLKPTKKINLIRNFIDDHQSFINEYSKEILEIGKKNKKVVCLDADLVVDTGLKKFKHKYPKQFIECGIAEQDMVSIAGTLALSGQIPIVHSFSCFLISRAAEQIYNNITQNSKVIYVGSLSGALPAAPGHSHQSLRDISLMSSMPNLIIIEPVDISQLPKILKWAINKTKKSVFLRINSIPFKNYKELNKKKIVSLGQGQVVAKGKKATIIALGPLMIRQAIEVKNKLKKNKKIDVEIISTIYANSFDKKWYKNIINKNSGPIFILENHFIFNGFFSFICQNFIKNKIGINRDIYNLGFGDIPACGTNIEVLTHHNLDINSIYKIVLSKL
ncbi:MAG: hypothetical protein CBB97_09050 [Candidatus Endolissoclinum sp. TMED37]|nr:MAG: hypothetical protein CBB97_09050 [Candidatus Endolissoclinum sp. TMED37]|tara:strand:- start:30 stop:1955 length:1926 start_codon:yes stop_codon:yes gene_type:complete